MKQVSEKAEVISMVPLRISSSSHTSTSCQSWHDMTWHDMTWHDMTCDVIWCDVMWCDVMSYQIMWCEMRWHDMTWHDMTWHDMTSYCYLPPCHTDCWCLFQYLMTHTIMSFAATANIIKQQTLSYTDLNYHNNHHLSLCNHTATYSRVALSCITYQASFCTCTCCLISSPPALSTSSLSCAFASLMAVNLPAYIYFPLSHFVSELCHVRTQRHIRSTLAPAWIRLWITWWCPAREAHISAVIPS
jgi:hypothetical protein